jgi:hypothetical protein
MPALILSSAKSLRRRYGDAGFEAIRDSIVDLEISLVDSAGGSRTFIRMTTKADTT